MNARLVKKHIAASFKSLVLSQSFKKITITEICLKAGISRRSFYYHFKDKYDLMKWIYLSEVHDFKLHNTYRPFDEYVWDRYYISCKYINSQKQYYASILADTSQNSFYHLMLEILTEPLIKGFGELYAPKTHGNRLITTLVLHHFEEAYNWLKSDSGISAEDFCGDMRRTCDQVFSMFLIDFKKHSLFNELMENGSFNYTVEDLEKK